MMAQSPLPKGRALGTGQGQHCVLSINQLLPRGFPGGSVIFQVFLMKWLVQAKGSSQEKRAAVSVGSQLSELSGGQSSAPTASAARGFPC